MNLGLILLGWGGERVEREPSLTSGGLAGHCGGSEFTLRTVGCRTVSGTLTRSLCSLLEHSGCRVDGGLKGVRTETGRELRGHRCGPDDREECPGLHSHWDGKACIGMSRR